MTRSRREPFRTRARTLKSWAKLREATYRKLAEGDRETALIMLLWLYFRHPDGRLRIADKIQQAFDREGMACLTIVRNRKNGITAAAVMSRFDASTVRMSEVAAVMSRFDARVEFRQAPVMPIELDLVEGVDRRGAPILIGHLDGTKFTAFVLRRVRDPATGEEKRIWKLVIRPPGTR